MSCITRAPVPAGHHRLTRVALQARDASMIGTGPRSRHTAGGRRPGHHHDGPAGGTTRLRVQVKRS